MADRPNIKQIVEQHLKAHGYDGLWCPMQLCSCTVGDLFPCGEGMESCEAGHKIPGCSDDCGEGCAFHIGRVPDPPKEGSTV